MAGLDELLCASAELKEFLKEESDKSAREDMIRNHLNTVCSKLRHIIPNFDTDLKWLNVKEPLSLSHQLEGKLLVLDFFTYCCINCMHVLPHLEELEQKHSVQDGLVVIGVHSAKFLNEKSTSNILSAVLRYGITHPVVNDSEALLWNQLQISCWPTFVIIGPNNEFLFTVAGEKDKDLLFEFVLVSLEYFMEKNEIKPHSIPLLLEREKIKKSPLLFPGKVSVTDNDDLVISDTGSHSILIVTESGVVKERVGGIKGYRDGRFEEARFSSPQGTTSLGNFIFVADTENHALRRIDLVGKKVETLAGTGSQGYDLDGGNTGTLQEISSPWDLHLGTSQASSEPDLLYIAMAGSHQIWVYFLKDATWYKNQQIQAKTCIRFAGSGNEENRNNSYPQKAAFAQPSGLALSPRSHLNTLYIADSESSSVRQILLKDGTVKPLVGGERDPLNLFAFGDTDGAGVQARLQHPLGVALVSEDGPLLVVDSYNNKVKSIDLKTKACSTVIGCGLPGNHLSDNLLEVELNEPGGVCVNQRRQIVYIADTNNHSIKVLNLATQTFSELPITFANPTKDKNDADSPVSAVIPDRVLHPVSVSTGCQASVEVSIHLKQGEHLNEEAPNSWKIVFSDSAGSQSVAHFKDMTGRLKAELHQTVTEITIPQIMDVVQMSVTLVLQLFICQADDTCTVRTVAIEQPINIMQSAEAKTSLIFDIYTSQL